MREKMHLNFDWYFNETFDQSHFKSNEQLELVNIPHTSKELPLNNFDEVDYQIISSYKKAVKVGNEYQGKKVILNFEGVMAYSEVFIDGKLVTTHKGGYLPFKVDITDEIVLDKEFEIFVKVDCRERDDIPPFGFIIDYLTYGGIYREVYIEFVDSLHIDNVFFKTLNILNEPILDMNIRVNNSNNKKKDVKITLLDGEEIIYFETQTVKLKESIDLEVACNGVELWDLKHPKLYTIEIEIAGDVFTDRVGFREVELVKSGFYLNGELIKLIGLNRHQSYPYVGYAMPKSAQVRDADILKYDLGLNCVRSSHYPPSKHFLDRCDEIGLLVFNEIPGWQHIGDEAWQEVAIENTKDMIERDFNHPSVFIWGVRINESQDNNKFYRRTNKLARKLDDTRPTGGVRFIDKSNLLEDVYTFNDFVHTGNNEGLRKPKSVVGKRTPYLVTEYNGHMFPTKKYDDESHRLEHAYRHLRVQEDNFKIDECAGALGWCMFDYNTHKDFGSGDKICYHGVMDIFRIEKYAASVYASQSEINNVMEVCTSMAGGDYPGNQLPEITIFTNCDFVKFYKNDQYINTFYPSNNYPNIPNAPIIIDDFIGDLLLQNERFNAKGSQLIKEGLNAVAKYGMNDLPLKYKLKTGWAIFRYNLKFQDLYDLYGKYVGNWGDKSRKFTFEGYKDGKLVNKVVKAPIKTPKLKIEVDNNELHITETYDVTRVIVKCVDDHENICNYAFDHLILKAEGIEVIGPKNINLIGGSVGFWVKTTSKGLGKVIIESERYQTQEITFEVK